MVLNPSQLLGAVGAVDVLSVQDEALVGEGQRALLAVKAVLVPGVVLIVHHVGPFAKTCDGILTARAFLGYRGLVAVHAVEVVLVSSEATASQWLPAGLAHEALRVPGLVLIGDPISGDGLLAAGTVLGELLLVARSAVEVIALGQEAQRADWLLALEAGEALLMPDLMLILHILISRHDDFVAALAAGGVLTSTTFTTHDLAIISSCKRLVSQRLVTLGAAEAVLVPVTVLMGQLLCINADWSTAFCAGVCAQLVEAADADVLIVLVDVFFTLQVVSAVEAVEALGHGGAEVAART